MNDIFSSLFDKKINHLFIEYLHSKRKKLFEQNHPFTHEINNLKIPSDLKVEYNEIVSISSKKKYEDTTKLNSIIKLLTPWRKGPFQLFENTIQSQWNSHIKYSLIESELKNLENKIILDLGCNNGYYMFRMLKKNPLFILGMDPIPSVYYQFNLVNHFIQSKILDFKLLGWQELKHFKKKFDIILCMGILYHHPSPIDILKNLYQALNKNGLIILETQTIDTQGSYALFPQKKYANASGMWFIPTIDCLINWIKRSGFSKVDVFHKHPLTEQEQTSSFHAPFEALNKHKNDTFTTEGYPPPHRTYATIKK